MNDAVERAKRKKVNKRLPELDSSFSPRVRPLDSGEEPRNENAVITDFSHYSENLETTRRTLRIEKALDRELSIFCEEKGITRDVFVESCFSILCQNDNPLGVSIVDNAKERYRERKRIGELRKLETTVERLRRT